MYSSSSGNTNATLYHTSSKYTPSTTTSPGPLTRLNSRQLAITSAEVEARARRELEGSKMMGISGTLHSTVQDDSEVSILMYGGGGGSGKFVCTLLSGGR